MDKPEKPKHLGDGPITFYEVLGGEGYSLSALKAEVNRFALNKGIHQDKVQICVDEKWTGYEECETSLALSGQETAEAMKIRLHVYKEQMDEYAKKMREYKDWCVADDARKQQEAVERKKRGLDAQIEELKLQRSRMA